MTSKRIIIFCFILLAIIIAVGAVLARMYVFVPYEYEPVRVEIPAGMTNEQVKTIFVDRLGSSFGHKVATLWRLQGGTPEISHGSYAVKPGQSAFSVARNIAKGRQTPVRLTFNNMRLMPELAKKASSVLEFDSAAFMRAVKSVLPVKGFKKPEFTAAFLPDTYEFYWTDDPMDVVIKLYKHREAFWNKERRKKAAALGLTTTQVHTLGSIIEEETNRRDERPTVARLYLNRLAIDKPLQSDPTVKFATGNFAIRRISRELTKLDNPYNTYVYKGLPPGPIRIIEAQTIDAILDAPMNDYLFMCARPDFSGYHDFTRTYDEHRIKAALYHKALDALGVRGPEAEATTKKQ